MHTIPIFQHEKLLPREIAGLSFEFVKYYPDPGLGVQIRYGTATTAKADAYLYNLGLAHIPEDLQGEEVVAWFRSACNDVMLAAAHGLYEDLQVGTMQYLHLPPDASEPFCLWAAFSYKQAAGDAVEFTGKRVSNLSLRVDSGYFNKVRYTYPKRSSKAGFQGFLRFLIEWTALAQETSVRVSHV